MKKILFLIFLFYGISLLASDYINEFRKANEMYMKGQYNDSIKIYNEIVLKNKIRNYKLYYNIGNNYYRLGKIGKAVLWWERARKLKPDDEDINYNLSIGQKKILDRFNVEEEPIISMIRVFSEKYSLFVSQISLIIFNGIFFIFVSIMRIKPFLKRRIYRRLRTGLLILLIILFAGYMWRADYEKNNVYGIISNSSAEVLSEPSAKGKVITIIHEGLKVKIIKRTNNFYQIMLPDDHICWIDKNNLEKI